VRIRLNTGSAVERELRGEGATATEAACAKRRFRALSDTELIRYANTPTKSQVDLLVPIILPCIRGSESGN
jgi:hypothetical protein